MGPLEETYVRACPLHAVRKLLRSAFFMALHDPHEPHEEQGGQEISAYVVNNFYNS